MITYLIKSTNEFRVDTIQEVEEFHKALQEKASNEGYTLSSFSWTEKTAKECGESYSFYFVKYSFVFNVLKNPENPFFKVEYPKLAVSEQTHMEQDEFVDEEDEW